MLPTFVIGLREGLEAALIVGIVAAFLRKQGRSDLLRWVFAGVGAAIALCVAVGVALELLSKGLPQRQQEGLETVIGVLAVGMVTYMVVWMRRHSRELKGQLEGLAADALASGSTSSRAGRAMVAMAFLAVLREGFETVVFLLAAFNESGSGAAAGFGAVLGIAVAVGLGYGIYRGGVRINLSKFFRATGLVLVFVAAGLVVNALHTAHEAGWLLVGQGGTVDLTWLVRPGSVQASLLTGMLGIQSHPVVIEVLGWLVYLIPVGCYVAWPPGRPVPRAAITRALLGLTGLAAAVALGFALAAPSRPASHPATAAGSVTAQLLSHGADTAVVRTQQQSPAASPAAAVGPTRDIALRRADTQSHAGLATDVFTATVPGAGAAELPPNLSAARIAALNGGHLPIGVRPRAEGLAARYRDVDTLTVWVEPRAGRIIDLRWQERVSATITDPVVGTVAIAAPVKSASARLPGPAADAAAGAARSALSRLDRHTAFAAAARVCAAVAVITLAAAGALALAGRRRPRAAVRRTVRDRELASS
jgi:high-affinity iron transporter